MYEFHPSVMGFAPVARNRSRFMVHRVNLPDSATATSQIKELVGSKSGIAVIDSAKHHVLLPPGSSAEVDFWVFGDNQTLVTHNNPRLSQLVSYPTLEQYLEAWNVKRECEKAMDVTPGLILANMKTHGGEEKFIDRCVELGIPASEIVLLDQEYPATDRISRERKYGGISPVALRVSRIEGMKSVLMTLEQSKIFATPMAVFYDPVGQEDESVAFPFTRENVSVMYGLAPAIEFVLCCPSRWGKRDQIEALAERLRRTGLKAPLVMTDIDLIPQWREILQGW